MNGAGLMLMFLLGISGFIVAIIILVLIIKAFKKPKLLIAVFLIIAIYLLVIFISVVLPAKRFDKIETSNPICDTVKNEITVLNFGTGSMGSFSVLHLSNDNTIKVTNEPHYQHYMNEKFGYTFSPINDGDVYVLVTEIDCADISYADVYHINVDDNVIASKEHEHIKVEESEEIKFLDYVIEKYNFDEKILYDEFEYYISKHNKN